MANKRIRIRDFLIMAALVVVWILIDQATKASVKSFQPNELIAGPFLGIFDITLVHNTGAAWGLFGGNAMFLGIFSILVCVLAVIYLALAKPPASIGTVTGLSLVVAGGIGNAIDRFTNQYVVDFIRPVFIDFPVFNFADIGVTVGIVVFVVSIIVESRRNTSKAKDE